MGETPDKQDKNRKKLPKNTFPPGKSGNPKGRPPLEKSVAKALRDLIDPQEVARTMLDIMRDDRIDARLRLDAAVRISDRLDGTPVQSLRTQSDDLPQIVVQAGADA